MPLTAPPSNQLPLILATESKYKQQVLNKLLLPYKTVAANIDETPRQGESSEKLVLRLAVEKARKVANEHPGYFVVAADQVACFKGEIIGKPYNKTNACNQLQAFSNNKITFLTGLALYSPTQNIMLSHTEYFDVYFNALSDQQINNYIEAEQPFDCAGSFKSEGLGILLFEKLQGRDPNALIGLPLIALNKLFAQAGVNLLDYTGAQLAFKINT